MSYIWHHEAYNLFQTSLFFLVAFIQVSSIYFCDLILHFFSFLNNIAIPSWIILLYRCTVICLFIQILKDILVASNVCVRDRKTVETKLLYNACAYFCVGLSFQVFWWTRSITSRSHVMRMFTYVKLFPLCISHFSFPVTVNESSCYSLSLLVTDIVKFL